MDKRFLLLFHLKEKDSKTQQVFIEAMKQNLHYHDKHCLEYHKILKESGCCIDEIHSISDLEKIPPIPTLLFKKHTLFSMPEKKKTIQVTSSGTSGNASQIRFEWSGLSIAFFSIFYQVMKRKLISIIPCHYIMLGYKPHKSNHAVISKTAYATSFMAPSLKKTYALTIKNGKYEVELDEIIKALSRAGKSHFPTRIIGFPSYAFFMMKKMEESGMKIKLPHGSKLLLGGGWKQFYTEKVEKEVLYEMAERLLGIKEDQIVEFFGAVEHPVIYCDCSHHHFHVPNSSHVIIRDPQTLKPLSYGQVGLVNLLSPIIKGTPLSSVMSDDLGILHDGGKCGCGNPNPYLEILGRVGVSDIKTCSTAAKEKLEEKI